MDSRDPRERTKSEEERIREKGDEIHRRATVTPDETVEEETTVSHTPSGEIVKRMSRATASPEALQKFTKKKRLFYTYRILWYGLTFVEFILAFRFILKLAGANPNSGFAEFVYALSRPFVGPFINLFSPTTGPGAETTAFVEWSTLIAGIVYVFLVWGVVKLIEFAKPAKVEEIEQTVESQS